MFRRLVFILAHLVSKPRVIWLYFKLLKNEKRSINSLVEERDLALQKYLQECKSKVYYYRDLIPEIPEKSSDFYVRDIFDSIPVLTKKAIIKNRERIELPDQYVAPFKLVQTGGSTGEPLKYRISRKCNDASFAILYRGLSRGGYRLGDKLAVMAGGSLVTKDVSVKSRLIAYCMNMRKYSSYGVSEELFESYFYDMKSWKPKFIRGYASSLYEFAKFVERRGFKLHFKSAFTTAEMLFDFQRRKIEEVFETEVFDCYGLNDGAVTAFECSMHNGLHVDLERGYLEVVDEDEKLVFEKMGKIVATSFLNFATPFIRYDTGDLGVLSREPCACGSPYPILKSLQGRVTDSLSINGKLIGSPVLTVLMGNTNALRYQFIKYDVNSIVIVIEKSSDYNISDENFIRESLFSQLGEFQLLFSYDLSGFKEFENGKHKIIVDNCKANQMTN